MDEREEAAYLLGQKAVYRKMMAAALRYLGGEALSREDLLKERADIIAVLRLVCNDHGDNDWDDGAYLSDVISGHLANHLNS